ncbi:MAG: DUF5752 family protein [Planctomycetota bacterium]
MSGEAFAPKPGEPFILRKGLVVSKALGLRANDLETLLRGIRTVDPLSIYYHVHHPYFSRVSVRPEYPSAFAIWTAKQLGQPILAERLSGIDLHEVRGDLEELRRAFATRIDEYLRAAPPGAALVQSPPDRAFDFCTMQFVVIRAAPPAATAPELAAALRRAGSMVVFYHTYDALVRLGRPTNDFAEWTRAALGREDLAAALGRLDPYVHSVDELRSRVIAILEGGV